MPNGRSGGFQISFAKFRELLQGLSGEITIGSQFGGDGEASVTASELAQRLERDGKEHVPVEEHDHSWYIAQLGTDYNVWVVIEETSPLYEGFRRCHAAWQMNQSQN